MARAPIALPEADTFVYLFLDAAGRPVVTLTSYGTYTVVLPNRRVIQYRVGTNIQLVDGLIWNPTMLNRNPPLLLGVCEVCRHPPFSFFNSQVPTHGLCSLNNSRRCWNCGQFCCPAHAKRSSLDRHWRCVRCAEGHLVWRLLNWIFYTRQEG